MPAQSSRPSAEEIVLYEKDPATKIAIITLNRPEALNAPTIAARQRYADLVLRANVDDDVKVLIIRGVGEHFGSGADLPEMAGMFNGDDSYSPLPEFRIADDEGVKYPPRDSYRYLANITNLYADARFGLRTLQDFKKISIVEAKGYCYGWHFYQAADADIVVASDDSLFGHSAFRYVGWAARQWQWATMMGIRPFMEMVFTGRPFTAKEMKELHFLNSVVTRESLEAETMKYALACARNRPTDTVVMQKTFFEIFKQNQGEYMGSILAGWLEGMLPAVRDEGGIAVDAETFEKGLGRAVKDNDSLFPAEWRMSYGARQQSEQKSEIELLREQLAAQQEQIRALERKLDER
jgi:enoyl-CoA hydratase/carnithine racemase